MSVTSPTTDAAGDGASLPSGDMVVIGVGVGTASKESRGVQVVEDSEESLVLPVGGAVVLEFGNFPRMDRCDEEGGDGEELGVGAAADVVTCVLGVSVHLV